MKFQFNITQQATTHYDAILTIKAKNLKSAIKKIQTLSEDEIEKLCDEWTLNDNTTANGPIEVYDDKGDLIN